VFVRRFQKDIPQGEEIAMNIRKAAGAGLVAGLGFLVLAGLPASAEGAPSTGAQSSASSASGDGVLSGNSGAVAVAIPVEIGCNANGVGIFGGGGGLSLCDVSFMGSGGDAGPITGAQQAASSASGDGVAAGNSGAVSWAIPVEIACNANGVGGAGVGIGGSACDVALFSS
jgi:hypothetical protein